MHWAPYLTALAFVLGWGFGAWTTCGPSCRFDVNLFEALGTWLGGVGVAVAAGMCALHRYREDNRSESRAAIATAHLCAARFTLKPEKGSYRDRVHIQFTNKTSELIAHPSLHVAGGRVLERDNIVAPGRGWGTTVYLSDLGLKNIDPQDSSTRDVLDKVKSLIVLQFEVRDRSFLRNRDKVYNLSAAPTHLLACDSFNIGKSQ